MICPWSLSKSWRTATLHFVFEIAEKNDDCKKFYEQPTKNIKLDIHEGSANKKKRETCLKCEANRPCPANSTAQGVCNGNEFLVKATQECRTCPRVGPDAAGAPDGRRADRSKGERRHPPLGRRATARAPCAALGAPHVFHAAH